MSAPPSKDVLRLLLARWKVILICGLLGTGGAVAYALLAPEWYTAMLTVVPSQRGMDPRASLAMTMPLLDVGSADVQRIQAVLTSTSVADEVIEKFNLEELYGTSYREYARAELWKHCTTAVDRRSSVVSLACEDRDPRRAKEMASYFGEVGNRVFGRVTASSAREERRFLETQVEKAREDVDAASRQLREFQLRHKLIDLPEQSTAVISAMASIKGELLSKQIELEYLASFSSRIEPKVAQLREQISVMERKLAQLETAKNTSPGGAAGSGSANEEFFPGAMAVPELRYELEQLLREQKTRETVFFLMTQRFETARVDEARDTSTFQILDEPSLPTVRSRPRRRKIVMLGAGAGLALALVLVYVPIWWRRREDQEGSS